MGEKGGKRRLEIIMTAHRLFITKGYDETSVDEIIAEMGIAKGTFYYHFKSKEELLESVIDMMINSETEKAKMIATADVPATQKIVGIISSLRPSQEEIPIGEVVNQKENIVMHEKVGRRIIEVAVPMLADVVREGINQGIFDCEYIEERVKTILILSRNLFDEGRYTVGDIEVFIDTVEKMLGAKKGTLGFIRELIGQ